LNFDILLISYLQDAGCLNTCIKAICPAHPFISHDFSDAKSIVSMIEKPNSFCSVVCRKPMPCGKVEHDCPKTCFPKHEHEECTATIEDMFLGCGHFVTRKCLQDLHSLKCTVKESVTLKRCGHKMYKLCHQKENQVKFYKSFFFFNNFRNQNLLA
jgi:hypothetical protein